MIDEREPRSVLGTSARTPSAALVLYALRWLVITVLAAAVLLSLISLL